MKCENCGVIRKLETMIYLLINPMEATEDEIQLLHKKREAEVIEFEKTLQEMKMAQSQIDWFYCLDTEWYFQWKAYVLNDTSESKIKKCILRISQNPEIGKNTNLF